MFENENKSTEIGPNCQDCRFAIMQDTGYSNWTVEGTTFFCARRLHPADGFDRWYGRDRRLDFAAECSGYENGEPVCLDVDGEIELTEIDRMILSMRGNCDDNTYGTYWSPTDE